MYLHAGTFVWMSPYIGPLTAKELLCKPLSLPKEQGLSHTCLVFFLYQLIYALIISDIELTIYLYPSNRLFRILVSWFTS